jgi:hypothetical protein
MNLAQTQAGKEAFVRGSFSFNQYPRMQRWCSVNGSVENLALDFL